MRAVLLFFCFCFWGTVTRAQCNFERLHNYYNDYIDGIRHIQLKDGGYLFYGAVYADTTDEPLSYTTLLLLKTDKCGNTVWLNNTGYIINGEYDMTAVETDNGHIIVSGFSSEGLPGAFGNIRVGKYDSNGVLLKEKLIKGSPNSSFVGMRQNEFKKNSCLIHGWTNDGLNNFSRPLFVEIDDDINIIRWKEYPPKAFDNSTIAPYGRYYQQLFKDSNSIIGFVNLSNIGSAWGYIADFDSNLTIKKVVSLPTDTGVIGGFYLSPIFWTKDRKGFEGYGTVSLDSVNYGAVIITGVDGRVQRYCAAGLKHTPPGALDKVGSISAVCPTKDGGYIVAGRPWSAVDSSTLYKLDSNFNTQWVKQTRGILRFISQLPDGGYLASGSSYLNHFSRPQIYMLKVDSVGNFFYTGTSEKHLEKVKILIYPNPTSGSINITGGDLKKEYTISAMDITGKKIADFRSIDSNPDLTIEQNGMYYIEIRDNNGELLHRQSIIVMR